MKKTMKKYLLISILALGVTLSAAAQGSTTVYPATVELNKARSAWFNSSNTAGMTIDPIARYSDLSLGYSIARGDFRSQPEGNTNVLGISTSGATALGGGQVWGSFDYTNHSAKETRFNTMTLNLEDDMPFIVSDANVSPWKKQRYDMSVKASTPLLGNLVVLGIRGNYFTESGAKQVDPRCEDYEYGVTVEPALAFHFNGHTIGLSGIYRNGKVREIPVNSNSQQDQVAYILRGMGFYTDAVVGSLSGIKTFYYQRNQLGGALQYGYKGDVINLLVEGGHRYQVVDAFQTPTKPQRMGTTVQRFYWAKGQLLIDNDKLFHKVTLEASHRQTDGIEYLQALSQDWYTLVSFIRSDYNYARLAAGYDIFRKNEFGYNWSAGVRGVVENVDNEYLLPESHLQINNFTSEIFGKKNFQAGKVSILGTVKAAYRSNLEGVYSYGGPAPTSIIVADFYEKEIEWMTASCWKAGADVNVAFPLRGRMALFCEAGVDFVKPTALEGNRLSAAFKVGITF